MKKQYSLKQLLIAIISASSIIGLAIFFFFFVYLPTITNHGESIVVPNLIGSSIEDLEERVIDRQLRYEISDSSFDDTQPSLAILKQFPAAGSRVKENRKIILSLNRVKPPTVPLPQLEESTLKNAQKLILANDLVLEGINYVPHIARNTVRMVYYKDKPIKPGTRIPKGSKLKLDIGQGGSSSLVIMNQLAINLYGTPYEDSKYLLLGSGLKIGKLYNLGDSSSAPGFIYKFSRSRDTVRTGTSIDLWIVPEYDSTQFDTFDQLFLELEYNLSQPDSVNENEN